MIHLRLRRDVGDMPRGTFTVVRSTVRWELARAFGLLLGLAGCPDAVREEDGLLTGTRALGGVGPVDLTTEGSLDWVHWGLGGVSSVNRKDAVTPQIDAALGVVGMASGLQSVDCCIEPFSWSDGTPTAAVSDVIEGIFVDSANPSGDGLALTVAAGDSERTLQLYVGAWCARTRLEARLGDGSAEPYVDTSLDAPMGATQTARYTITFRAASPQQSLHVELTVDDNHCTTDDVGEVWLFAAALHE